MSRKYLYAALALGALHSSAAHASWDMSCSASTGNVTHSGYDVCNSVPFLSPANDSRLNLQMLLVDSGKLTVSVDRAKPDPSVKDVAMLAVPFDMGNWRVRLPGTPPPAEGKAGDAGSDGSDSNDYAQGEGSRCRSGNDGQAALAHALEGATGLPANEAAALNAARLTITSDCSGSAAKEWKTPAEIHTPLGLQFATYVEGANAFYAGHFDDALKDFQNLKDSTNPWLKETSRYMLGRTQINSATQQALGEWGDLQLDKVDKNAVSAAETAFKDYLHDYPHGEYAVSAQGLLRRVYWLGGDGIKLADAYDQAFATASPDANVTLPELVQEVDNKLLVSMNPDQVKSPQMLALIDLMLMRPKGAQPSGDDKKLSLADLQAQKDRFASKPELYAYLQAAFNLYVEPQPAQALASLPTKLPASLDYFAFSEQTLRVFALEASQHFDDARALVVQLLPVAKLPMQHEQLELMLAMIDEHTGHVERVFAADSPVTDPAIRMILLEQVASADLLRQRIKAASETAQVRDAALYTLLYKELTGGKYQDFQTDLALMPAQPSDLLLPFVAAKDKDNTDYICPPLRDVAAALQQHADDPKGLICVGELVRVHDVHYGQGSSPGKTDLGGSPSAFPAADYARQDAYLKVISNDHAAGDVQAYALYRAINCYAPSGNNDCGGKDVPKETRKQWFHTLKTVYADSSWASSLKYYW